MCKMDFDDVLVIIGEFGWYQKRLYAIVALPCIFLAFQTMNFVFIFGEQDHRCKLPTATMINSTEWTKANETYIWNPESSVDYDNESFVWSTECKIFAYYNSSNVTNEQSCTEWEYDTTTYTLSGTSEFNLVCENKFYKSVAAMASFVGTLFAALIMGTLGDVLGRKVVLCLSLSVMFTSDLALAWSPNIQVFCVIHFITGFSQLAYFSIAVVTVLELVGPSMRTFAGLVIELVYCVGVITLCGIAYFIRNWRHLQLTLTAPSIIMLFYWLIIPESPRWLIATGQTEKAMVIIKKIAKVNKRTLPSDIGNIVTEREVRFKDVITALIRSKVLMTRFINLTLSWFVIVFSYYGLSYNVGRLGGSPYLNIFLSSLVETLGYSLCLFFTSRFGRKRVNSATLILAGAACLATIFTEVLADKSYHWMTITLALIGKCGVSMAFGNIFIYTPELFPTYARSFVLGACNIGARIGSITSPYIANIGDYVNSTFGKALPLMIFGGLTIFAGFLSLMLPETLNKKLPQTIQDAVTLQRNSIKTVEEEDEPLDRTSKLQTHKESF